MLFEDRKEFRYDPELAELGDTPVVLRMFDEYVRAYSPKPPPKFFEVERKVENIDPIYHMPVATSPVYSRTFADIPTINQFSKPSWKLTRLAISYQRRDFFWLSYLSLKKVNWWPLRGDQVDWNGYRYMLLEVVLPPECYIAQTGAWTGIVVDCIVPADGDAVQGWPKKVNKMSPP